ncbi:hypothetical protein P872_00015 [Rhodonellum psychrophilum GCM71 = DSM 17998]|uniref:ABC transporter ATPase n=2 Tax=Rhodonellum TaxID=336827 RepID=U5C3K1_9BACT|nr:MULTISPECIES: hypothetical protein [Rhodonellum]ERM83496.1 hypothetical protein P872_00015 [Rhodonellum psychrophilum GCM71 = DSM 17998]SDY51192.1 hypothetical protein SAMN05444412_101379 [Rhodonellum ikkaensis]
MYISFDQMSENSRIWVYQANRKLTSAEQQWISDKLKVFCEQWNTHGALMPTSFAIRFDQVILMAVDESQLGASGCSIDSSVRTLKEIEKQLQINLLDQGKVSFLSAGNDFEMTSVLGVKAILKEGKIKPDTVILNPLIAKKSDLDKKWLIPAKESWLNKYFANS